MKMKVKISTAAVKSIINAVQVLPAYQSSTPVENAIFLSDEACVFLGNRTTGEVLQFYKVTKEKIYRLWVKNNCHYSKDLVFEVWSMLEQRKPDCDILERCSDVKKLSDASLQSIKSHIYSLLKKELLKEFGE